MIFLDSVNLSSHFSLLSTKWGGKCPLSNNTGEAESKYLTWRLVLFIYYAGLLLEYGTCEKKYDVFPNVGGS